MIDYISDDNDIADTGMLPTYDGADDELWPGEDAPFEDPPEDDDDVALPTLLDAFEEATDAQREELLASQDFQEWMAGWLKKNAPTVTETAPPTQQVSSTVSAAAMRMYQRAQAIWSKSYP